MGFDNLADAFAEFRRLKDQVSKLASANPIGFSALTHGRLRIGGDAVLLVDSSGGLVVHGSINGDGTITWTGAFTLSGATKLQGTTRFEGDTTQVGPLHIQGATDITGALTINGLVTLLQNLQVNAPGKITIAGGTSPAVLADGSLTFGTGAKLEADGAGARLISGTGPRLYVFPTSIGIQYDPTHGVQSTSSGTTVTGNLAVTGSLLVSGTPKSFIMDHPIRDGWLLQHASTESPVSGVEYWGDETIGDDGATTVELPAYFEALTSQEGRAVLVTGRGFAPDWTDIDDGSFTVTGEPGRRFSWLVKAARADAGFEAEHEGTLPTAG